jgi:hypothetical protein
MTPEGRVKADIKKYLALHGAWWYMPVQTGYGVTGVPDFIVCWQGRFLGVECKAPGKENTVTPGQQKQLEGIQAAQGCSCVVSSVDQLKSWLSSLHLV